MSREPLSPELESLLVACVEDDCNCELSQRIKEAVEQDSAALVAYVDVMRTHAMLQWRYSARLDVRQLEESFRTTPPLFDNQPRNDNSDVDAAPLTPTPPVVNESIPSPALGFLSAPLHGTVGWFSSGWPVAYLIATVILTTGMLVAAFTYVSQPGQVATKHWAPASSRDESLAAPVGRVTGTADCQWAKGFVPLLVNDAVPVGREVRLESGLMEITYDTGAKVILQGPVTYEVESADGGYLAVGKLTARIGGGGRGTGDGTLQDAKSQIPNLKSRFPTAGFPGSRPPAPRPPVLRSHSHRHGDRPGDRVRRGGRYIRSHGGPCISRRGERPTGRC